MSQRRARLRPVEIGERGDGYTRIVSGVAEGELVIVYPSPDIEDGTRVRVR